MGKLTKSFVGVLVLSVAVLVARTFVSFAFVAGTVGQTLSGGYGAFDVQRGLSDGLRSLQTLVVTLSPQTGRRNTLSVLDVPGELERLARTQRDQATGEPQVLKVR